MQNYAVRLFLTPTLWVNTSVTARSISEAEQTALDLGTDPFVATEHGDAELLEHLGRTGPATVTWDDLKDDVTTAQARIEPLREPLELSEWRNRADTNGNVTGTVQLALSDAIIRDADEWITFLSEQLTGLDALTDVGYTVVGVTDQGELLIEVTGNIALLLSLEEEELTDSA